MVRRANHDTDNAQCRLLTIQHRLITWYMIAMERVEDEEDSIEQEEFQT